MFLNGHHIVEFAINRWGLTKKALAKGYLFCSIYSLSRKNKPLYIEPRKGYNNLFNVDYKGSAAKGENKNDLLNALIDYLEKNNFKRDADFIADKIKSNAEYKNIIIELLRRANTHPDNNEALDENKISEAETLENKILNKSEDMTKEKEIYEMRVSLDSALEKLEHDTLGQGIYSVFREIYDDSGIPDYIQGMPKREFDITPFVKDIEQNLLEIYRPHFYAEMYMLVVEFCNELKKFNNLTALYTLEISAESRNELVAQQRKRLESLYKSMGASKIHNAFISHEYDLATDEVVYKRFSILDN